MAGRRQDIRRLSIGTVIADGVEYSCCELPNAAVPFEDCHLADLFLARLPRALTRIVAAADGQVHVGAHVNLANNSLWWTRVQLSELPNDLATLDDLERAGIKLCLT